MPLSSFSTRSENNLDLLLSRATNLKKQLLNKQLANANISASQLNVILALSHKPATNVIELSRHLGISTGPMSRMIERIALKGFISRKKNHDDRREVRITLTPAGIALAKRLSTLSDNAMCELFGALDAAELQQLSDIVWKLLQAHGVAVASPHQFDIDSCGTPVLAQWHV